MDNFREGIIQLKLTDQIKTILTQYPDDGQILKEIIQNAEDARATEVKFFIDDRSYSTSQLYSQEMDKFQGPALLAYNDGIFKKEDWESIRMIYQSNKAKDVMKIGRFGMGFKSVFHITDLPSFISESGIAYLDPHENLFYSENSQEYTSSYLFDIKKHKEEMSQLRDQWQSFEHPATKFNYSDFEREEYYRGTLFRFPLRVDPRHSKISKTVYDPERLSDIFESIKREGPLCLLFLKSVESVQLYKMIDDNMKLYFEVKISPNCLQTVRQKKEEFLANVKDKKETFTVYKLDLESHLWCDDSISETKHYSYLVCHYLACPTPETKLHKLASKQNIIPLVGLAYPLDSEELVESQVFCFLPLPFEETDSTGLKFHVNGYFAVDSNRRHLKWPTQGERKISDEAQWNMALINDIMPKALTQMILQCIDLKVIQPEKIYRLFPDPDCVKEHWKFFTQKFYEMIKQKNLILCDTVEGSCWQKLSDCNIFNSDWSTDLVQFSSKILLRDGRSCAKIPKHVYSSLVKYFEKDFERKEVSLSLVCKSFKRVQRKEMWLEHDRLVLLSAIMAEQNFMKLLKGMELIPLMNGKWISISQSKSDNVIYVENGPHKRTLLYGDNEHHFVNIHSLQDVIAEENLRYLCQNSQIVYFDEKNFIKEFFACQLSEPLTIESSWIKALWKYLRKHFKEDLSKFSGKKAPPILPISSEEAVKIPSPNDPAILANSESHQLSDLEIQLLSSLEIRVFANVENCALRHPGIREFLVYPSQEGKLSVILKRLSHSNQADMISKVKSLNDTLKKQLRIILCGIDINTLSQYTLLRKLDIFKTLVTSSNNEIQFISAEKAKGWALQDDFLLSPPESFIHCEEAESRTILSSFGVKFYNSQEIFSEILKTHFPKGSLRKSTNSEIAQKFAMQCLRKCDKNSNVFKILAETRFVKTKCQGLRKPKELLDPMDEVNKTLADDKLFPCGVFESAENLSSLRELGLRNSEKLRKEEVISMCSILATNPNKRSLSEMLLSYFERNLNIWRLVEKDITEFDCLPTCQTKPDKYPANLFWKGSDTELGSISNLRSISDAFFCGSVAPCLVSKSLTTGKPLLSEVIAHLKQCLSIYRPEDKAEFLFMIKEIYRYLHDDLPSEKVISELKKQDMQAWIFVGDTFAPPEQCVFQCSMKLEPHIYVIPLEMMTFKRLFSDCGVQETCSYKSILSQMKCHYDVTQDYSQSERDKNYAISMIHTIIADAEASESFQDLAVPIMDENLKFKLVSECTYCDSVFSQSDLSHTEGDSPVCIVHPDLPPQKAKLLGVPSLMSKLLTDEDLCWGTSFGQTVSLTDTLKSLLDEYRDGLSVVKEIIQNADDANANVVKFLYDERSHDNFKSSLFDPSMNSLQGPALLAYNDAKFTEADFQNICKVGGATKEMSADKIGRFGYGFNAVYNLTEAPSFISDTSMVFFDPQKKYLGQVLRNQQQPGIRLKLDRPSVKNQLGLLKDQFHPYNGIFHCNLDRSVDTQSYCGTLFRLPLRTGEQARNSSICKKAYSHEDIIDLLRSLHANRHDILVFTQNVTKIEVYHLSDNPESTAEPIEQLFVIEKEAVKTFDSLPGSGKNILKTKTEVMTKPSSSSNAIRYSSLIKSSCSLTPNDLLDLQIRDCEDTCHYVQSSALKFSNQSQKSVSSLPIGGVAIKVTDEDRIPETLKNGLLYCFLPLPRQVDLPFHVNGYFFVSSNRTELYTKDIHDKDSEKFLWNREIMHHSVVSAYLRCLHIVKTTCPINSIRDNWYSIWPRSADKKIEGKENLLWFMTQSFYTTMFNSKEHELFLGDNKWSSFSNCVFLDPKYLKSPIASSVQRVFKKVISSKNKEELVICLPKKIIDLLKTYNNKNNDKVLSRMFSKDRFLTEIFFPNCGKISTSDYESILLYTLHEMNVEKEFCPVIQAMTATACVPVLGGEKIFRKPDELIDERSYLSSLYSKEDHRFLKWSASHMHKLFDELQINDREVKRIYQNLGYLGMKSEDISWKELISRAKTVTNLEFDLGWKRATVIINLVRQKLSNKDIPSTELSSQLKSISFLPVKKRPKHFKLIWNNHSQIMFCSPNEGFHEDLENLVCCCAPIVNSDSLPSDRYFWKETTSFLSLTLRDVPLEIVIKQLQQLIPEKSTLMDRSLLPMFYKIYHYLNEMIAQDHYDIDSSDFSFKTRPIIAIESFPNLLTPDQCCKDPKLTFTPYLCGLPSEFISKFSNLIEYLEIKDAFTENDLISILHKINEEYSGKRVSDDQLQLCSHIIPELCRLIKENETDAKSSLPTIYLPNKKCEMRDVSSLCYRNKTSWLCDSEEENLVHENIALGYCEILGIKTLEQEALSGRQFGLPFGQYEKLTNRIKRLLSGYPFNESILKELLQNADDAGASKLHFILDKRRHSIKKIFGESWIPLQGPALLVYNDKGFTDEDIAGIQRLGEGSKAKESWKTGQYGVGFNCVYHITNTPSFFTFTKDETNLCVFDPLCKYVPGAGKESPGQRFKDIEGLKKDFPDVFSCYKIKGIVIDENNPGTLFRFPLRINDNVDSSPLIDNSMEIFPETIEYLFQCFLSDIDKCLLFLNNVKSVKFFTIDETSEEMNLVSSVEANILDNSQTEQHKAFKALVDSESKKFENHKKITEVARQSTIYELTVNTASQEYHHHESAMVKSTKKWIVAQQFGFDPAHISPEISQNCSADKIVLSPKGGSAFDVTNIPAANDEASRHHIFCLLPLPIEIDLSVHINGHFSLDYETRRNLADEKTKFGKWNKLLIKSAIVPAYTSLILYLKKKIPPEDILTSLSNFEDWYYGLFPKMSSFHTHNGDDVYLMHLCTEFYKYVHASGECFFPMLKESKKGAQISWHPAIANRSSLQTYFHSLDSQSFPFADRKGSDENDNPARDFVNTVKRCGMIIIDAPQYLTEQFSSCCLDLESLSPKAVLLHLKGKFEVPLPKLIEETPFKSIYEFDLVFSYVVKVLSSDLNSSNDKNEVDKESIKEFQALLQGSPLLLTADRFIRQLNSSNSVFQSKFFFLISKCPNRFLHQSLLSIDSPILKSYIIQFTVEDFAKILEYELPKSEFFGRDLKLDYKCLKDKVGGSWLRHVWKFISSNVQPKDDIQKCLEPLSEWHLLPVHVHKDKLLIPIKYSNSVIFLTDSVRQYNTHLFDYLDKLGIYQPNFHPLMKIFHEHGVSHAKREGKACSAFEKSLGSASNPEHVYSALNLVGVEKIGKLLSDPPPWNEKEIFKSILSEVKYLTIQITEDVLYDICMRNLSCCKFFNLKTKTSLHKYFLNKIAEYKLESESLQRLLCQALSKAVETSYQNFISETMALAKILCKKTFQPTDLPNILHIPIFNDICGNVLTLDQVGETFYLPGNVYALPTIDLDIWTDSSDANPNTVAFLKADNQLRSLYKFINCEEISIEDLYLQIIIPRFHSMSADGQYKHLEFIRDLFRNTNTWKQLKKTDKLICELARLDFITDESSGKRHTVDYFYNPDIPVFKSMYPERLLPKKYGPEWIDFLLALGLITKVDDDIIIELATKIAESAEIEPEDESIREKSLELLKVFYNEESHSSCLLDTIKTIPFLPAYICKEDNFVASFKHGKIHSQEPYISFLDTTFEAKFPIIWTQLHALPSDVHPSKWIKKPIVCNDLLTKLGVIIEPDLQTVSNHLLCLCDNWSAENYQPLIKQIQPIYEHISAIKNLKSHDHVIQMLKTSSIIPLEDKETLVKPMHTITTELLADDEIRPYLCKLPLSFGPYEEIFLAAGAQKSPTVTSYMEVLRNINKDLLDGAEFETWKPMIEKAFADLVKSFLNSSNQISTSEEDIYLPGCDQKLHRSQTLVYADFTLRSRALALQQPLLDSMTVTEHKVKEFIDKLPADKKPSVGLVSEEIKNINGLMKLDRVEPICKEIACKINDNDFIYAVLRFAFHTIDDIGGDTINHILESLKDLEIVAASEIKTVILYEGQEASETEKTVFLDTSGEINLLYLYGNPREEMMYCNEVIACILKLMGVTLDTMTMYMLLRSDNLDNVLDTLGIKQLPERFGHLKPLLSVGENIHLAMYHLMVQDSQVGMKKGDYIAYEILNDIDDDVDSKFVFVKCLELFEPSIDSYQKKLKIYLGEGKEITVSSLYLYKLKRIPLVNDSLKEDSSDNKIEYYQVEDKKTDIRRLLKLAKSSITLFQQLTKRLLIQWHPNRNPNDIDRCQKIYEFIQQEIESLDLLVPDRSVKQYIAMHQIGLSSHSLNPQPSEAKRWLKQALYDLEVAVNDDLEGHPKGYEWVGLKCHQAVEKALKAVKFATTGEKSMDHYLPNLCWDDSRVRQWCSDIESIGSSVSFRYPDQHAGSIPHDYFTQQHARQIRDLASKVIDEAKTRVQSG